jgi:DNA-binding beta-propeller fold protein YncE
MLNEPAPELQKSLEWINCGPTTLQSMRGYVVVVAFWSAGSAYSHNLLEDLRQLRLKYAGALHVIAVHVPKFEAERDPQMVRKACARLGVGLRVAHDPDFVTWQHYGVVAWPTAVVVDPAGVIREYFVGDRQREGLEDLITALIAEDEIKLIEGQLPPLRETEPQMALSFPSGICVKDNFLYVADTGHHAVLECNQDGRVLRKFGGAVPDFMDGIGPASAFRRPRGLATARDAIYVADTGNHAVRRIQLIDGNVTTLAGSGRAGDPSEGAIGSPRSVSLNQPWAVVASDDRVFIASSGNNQIWAHDRMQHRFALIAGSGQLGLRDGDARDAAFAQPTGITLVHALLYVVDSSSSAVRSVAIGTGKTQTLLGQGLFDYGDKVGVRAETRLQYPTAVVKDPDTANLWVLDSYNNAIRKLKLGGTEVATFELKTQLQRPLAMAIGNGSLWIANTDAHEILRVNTSDGEVRRLPVGE